MTHALGRIESTTDYRDHQFLARTVAPRPKPGITRRRWFVPPAWDQGSTPQCTAYAGLLLLNAGPVRNKQAGPDAAEGFYAAEQQIDGFPNPHDGSTVRASMQVMQAEGYIGAYRWAFTVPDVTQWLLTRGPVQLGTDWLDSMFDPITYRRQTWINFQADSSLAGGHSYTAFEVDTTKRCPDGSTGAVMIQNSWSGEWADKGRAWLSFAALAALLAEDGEAGCPDEILKRSA
jgi:hypothetical protein